MRTRLRAQANARSVSSLSGLNYLRQKHCEGHGPTLTRYSSWFAQPGMQAACVLHARALLAWRADQHPVATAPLNNRPPSKSRARATSAAGIYKAVLINEQPTGRCVLECLRFDLLPRDANERPTPTQDRLVWRQLQFCVICQQMMRFPKQ